MIKSLAIVSLLTSAALAQSSGAPAPSPSSTASPFIPSGITQSCTDFLNTFNSDASMTTCTSSLVTITSAYAPGGSATLSPSTSQIQSTLNNLCSTSTSTNCPESDMRNWLAQFYQKCSAELTSKPVDSVKQTYDVLYALTPFRTALCSKDDDGSYCVTKVPAASGLKNAISTGGSSVLTPGEIMNSLSQKAPTVVRRADTTALLPNITTFKNTNILFLFLQPECKTCTRNVLASYLDFESNTPYAPGLGQSVLLASQTVLYDNVTNTCGKPFLSGAVQAAGGLSGGTLSSSAIHNVVSASQGFVVVGVCMLAMVVSSIV